ncbi:MAG: glycosyltransferase family 2 protein [Blautia sp.]
MTAACMLVKKSVFDAIGGFDESFVVSLNDVDLSSEDP